MKKSILFLTLIFLCVMGVFHSIDHVWAQVRITFTRAESFTENKYPVPNETFDFNVSISFDTPPTSYVEIYVDLDPSNFKGTAANGGSSFEDDLYFLAADNGEWDEVQRNGTRLMFNYTSQNTTLPTSLKVRCRDYGAYGQIDASIEGEEGSKATGYIPWDVNENKIADGWEKMHGIYIPKKNGNAEEAIAKAEADDERGPSAMVQYVDGTSAEETCENDGDGWSVYDEYRGLYTTIKEDKPAGHERLDPKTKNIMYTSRAEVAKYGTGALPGIMMHSFMHVDHRLYQKKMKDGKDILDPFTDIYVYQKVHPYEIGHIKEVDSRIGRVNYNSDPGGGALKVPGAKSVWSIRIVDNGSDNVRLTNKSGIKYPARQGNATPGSPSKYSLAVILTDNIDLDLDNIWRDKVAKKAKQKVIDAEAEFKSAAKEKLIPVVIGHEVGHCLNATHCNNPNCIMNQDTAFVFFPDGSFHIIKKKYNDAPKPKTFEEELNYQDIIVATDDDGEPIKIDDPIFANSHIQNLAVTGQPGRHNNIKNCRFEIGFMSDEDADDEVGQSPSPTVPGSPVFRMVLIQSDTQVLVWWGKPSDDGGSPITDYEYRYQLATATTKGAWASAGVSYRKVVSNLTAGETYTIEMRAKNSVGYSDPFTARTFTMPITRTVSTAPRALSAEAGNGSVKLSWTEPSDDGNSPILRYEYRYGIGKSVTPANYTSWASMGSAMSTFPVSPLTNDMYHIFEVRAVNAIGNSAPSAPATATPKAPTIPGVPTGITTTASNATVTLSWTAPTDNGGGIDKYQYRVDKNNDGTWGDWIDVPDGATSVNVSVENGVDYAFQVRSNNSAGSSTQSVKSSALPVDSSVSPPSVVGMLSATPSDGQVRLSWDAPATGTPVIAYEYKYDKSNDGSWSSWKLTTSTGTSHNVTGLTNDTIYAFKVRARNTGGIGTQSSKVTATPFAYTVPGIPRNLTASITSNYSVRLDWDAPLDNGGTPITDYEYRRDTSNDGTWSSWGTTGDNGTDEIISNVTRGVTYAFRVRAVNIRGGGTPSDKATITIPAITPPSAPQNFSATAAVASVALLWTAPADDGGDNSITYQYRYRSSGSYTAWSAKQSGTAATIGTLTPGTLYHFEVRANNSAGDSPAAIDMPRLKHRLFREFRQVSRQQHLMAR